jgi:hypothetical protein
MKKKPTQNKRPPKRPKRTIITFEPDPTVRDLIEKIRRSGYRIGRLINDALAEGLRIELQKRRNELETLVELKRQKLELSKLIKGKEWASELASDHPDEEKPQ